MTKAPKKTKTTKSTKASKTSAVKSKKPTEAPIAPPVEPTAPPVPDASVVTSAEPLLSAPAMRKKELLEAVVAQSGMKKKDVKPVVEAMLTVLGDALAQDRELNLPPFAKVKIQKVKQLSGARVTVARLRQSKPSATAAE